MTFTVAITVHRTEQFLPHALETVFWQTHHPAEVKIYSDGASPATTEMLCRLAGPFPVSYEAVERRPELYGNHLRRRAIEQARTTHICFLGHDCLLAPTYLESHAKNLAGDHNGLSVVPIAYWRGTRRDVGQPSNLNLMGLRDGEIDLLCIAFPRQLALQHGCFRDDMNYARCADFLSFERLRHLTVPRFQRLADQAAHF